MMMHGESFSLLHAKAGLQLLQRIHHAAPQEPWCIAVCLNLYQHWEDTSSPAQAGEEISSRS